MRIVCNLLNGTFETFTVVDGEYIEEIDFVDFIDIVNEYLPKNMRLKAKVEEGRVVITLEGEHYENENQYEY